MTYVLNSGRLFIAFVLVAMISACASINPVSQAETPEQKAYAAYGTFVILEENLAVLLREHADELPQSTVQRMVQLDAKAKPVADALLGAAQEYLQAQSELSAGETSSDKAALALQNLEKWTASLLPYLTDLRNALKGVN